MLWLAWRIASWGPVGEGKTSGSPLTFLQAALFQWVNPKAWVITISAIATYTPGDGSLWPVILVALVCGVVNFPTIGLWTMFGTLLRSMLTQPTFLRVFNISMAVLLVLRLRRWFGTSRKAPAQLQCLPNERKAGRLAI